jgi:pre-mRNA-splicing factor 38B
MEYGDSPYVKCVGFLYMRYCSDPSALWNKLSKYMYIDEKFCPSLDQENIVGEGEYVENLFTELNYYGTRLPRIPIMIEREIKKKIMIHHEKKLRRAENLKILPKFRPGKEVRVHSTDQRIRNGMIESIEGKLVKVNYARCNNNQNSGDLDGFKQLEKLEE